MFNPIQKAWLICRFPQSTCHQFHLVELFSCTAEIDVAHCGVRVTSSVSFPSLTCRPLSPHLQPLTCNQPQDLGGRGTRASVFLGWALKRHVLKTAGIWTGPASPSREPTVQWIYSTIMKLHQLPMREQDAWIKIPEKTWSINGFQHLQYFPRTVCSSYKAVLMRCPNVCGSLKPDRLIYDLSPSNISNNTDLRQGYWRIWYNLSLTSHTQPRGPNFTIVETE